MAVENMKQIKGANRANEVRRAKTQGVIFYLKCLNAGAVITELYRDYYFKHLTYNYRHSIVKEFEKLPQPKDAFYQMLNSYRAMKIMEILGKNVNPGHLKQFSKLTYGGVLPEQNHQECQEMLSIIKANKRQYKKMLDLIVNAFVDDLKLGWAKDES